VSVLPAIPAPDRGHAASRRPRRRRAVRRDRLTPAVTTGPRTSTRFARSGPTWLDHDCHLEMLVRTRTVLPRPAESVRPAGAV